MLKYFFTAIAVPAGMFVFAQTAVRNEPRHHNVFENKYIRILDVFLAPKDTTQFHIHNTPSVFITFTKTTTGSQLIGQQATSTTSVAGYIWYDSLATPRIHRVWNEDSTWFHVMDIELTGSRPGITPAILQNSLLNLLFNAPLANGYYMQLDTGKELQVPAIETGYLLLSTGDAIIDYTINNLKHHRLMKAGHYLWIDSGTACRIVNNSQSTGAFLLLQLK